ncbi:galactoside alpha-(1,2)-fucosyltransferase 1-like [Mercenaria mercenaria]|uniref:galactoside alpha-(1,2)-fucosyltransferase 1-like n=1 Tax=Mercenaria mercenaria TaxID=6596 RepID=UPI00234EB408|nr:galactoside alpha-(1,2)-fucosyltransferase 1-like [Mercenaria mercenaria]
MVKISKNYTSVIFSTLISFVLCITSIYTWKRDVLKYTTDYSKSRKCNKILWDKNEFSEFISNERTIKNVANSTPKYRNNSCQRFIALNSPGGRTGNQLFQIAALFGIAFDYDLVPIIKPSFPLLKYFDLPNVSDVKLKNSTTCAPQLPGIFHDCFNSTETDTVLNMTIHGLFQSWKYFKNSVDRIRTILKIRPEYLQTAKLFLEGNNKDGRKNICIHVRRGDMAREFYVKRGFAVVDINFINKAIQFCEMNFKDALYFVLSNDIKWCKENIKRKVVFSNFKDSGYDLALMTLCDHVVVTSGSFGWWGAWLSKGTAVYFNGYPRPGSQQDTRFSRQDYYPSNWIGLS